MKKLTFGVGRHETGTPVEQGRAAALAALAHAGKVSPALAILVGGGPERAAEYLRGAREVLGGCPLVGAVAAPGQPGVPPAGAALYLVASTHLQAKVGVGTSPDGDWDHEVREAFKGSYIASPVPDLPEGAPERNLYRWYLYRRPSLLHALILSRPAERESRERHVAAYLRHRLGERTPILVQTLLIDEAPAVALADDRILASGVVLTVIKTDLRLSLAPVPAPPGQGRLVLARAEGEHILEHPLEIPCGPGLRALLGPAQPYADVPGLRIAFQRELDPVAVAAAENERLLREIVQLKDLHQRIFDGIGYGIAVIDAGQRVLFSNNTYWDLLGGSPEASARGGACPWSAAAGAVCESCAAAETIGQNGAVNQEIVRTVEGAKRWYRLDTFPLRDAGGAVTSAIEVVRDITAFRNLRSSLESEQRKMAAVIRGMGETLYIVNRAYDLQFFHRGDFPFEVAVGGEGGSRKCHRAIFGRELPCPWCRMPETADAGVVERRTASVAEDSGEERSYQITFSPSSIGQGEQGTVACLLVDISAQKRIEQQMVLSEKLNSLSILSAGMAHELNNPLGAINFNIEILKRRERDAEYQEVLESIRKDVLRINRIVGNLLSFSRSGSAASAGPVSLPGVIDATLEIFQVVIERRHIEVRRSWPERSPEVWASAPDLQQVFINLIANAIDAMPGGGTIDIAVATEERPAAAARPLVVVVYDTTADLANLRPLIDVPGWDVRFFKGDEEAIDYFRQNPKTPPEVLILDYAAPDPDRIGFFAMMARECAVGVQVLVIAGPDGGQPLAEVSGVSGVLNRPLGADMVMERVRETVARFGQRALPPPEVVVRFADTGVGIPPDVQERIFDPFFTTKDVKGTGLGLSVVHKILENHGATIQVGSSPGQGTHFTMRFPQAADPGVPFRMQDDGTARRMAR